MLEELARHVHPGETVAALSQGQRVAADRDALVGLLVGSAGSAPGTDLADMARMFVRLTDSHSRRMARLGLSA